MITDQAHKIMAARAEWHRRVDAEYERRISNKDLGWVRGSGATHNLYRQILTEAPPIPEYGVPAVFPAGWAP